MGRSIYCSTCKKEKEPGRENESRCKVCRSEANKQKRLAKRLERGLRPLGSGRSPNCYKCKAVKENPKSGYCNACQRKCDNEWRINSGKTKKHQTGLCSCGNERAPYSRAYCKDCITQRSHKWRENYQPSPEVIARKNERQRLAWHKKHGDKKVKLDPVSSENRLKYHKMAETNDERIIRHRVRSLTRGFIKAGKLIKQPCEICKTEENVEAHHDDYDKPMDIRWLCRKHHREHHKMFHKEHLPLTNRGSKNDSSL